MGSTASTNRSGNFTAAGSQPQSYPNSTQRPPQAGTSQSPGLQSTQSRQPYAQGGPPAIGFAPNIVQGQSTPGYPPQGPVELQTYPPQQNPPTQPGPPPNVTPQEWDDKRSLILIRVLSADEFLGRMDETDEKVGTLSGLDPEERKDFLGRIEELLGLRGHLQDELLRIQEMLAEDDPQLTCVREFEADFPRVIQKMIELRDRARLIPSVEIEAVEIQTENGETGIALETIGTGGPDVAEMGTQARGSSRNSMGTNTDDAFRPNGGLPSRTSFALQKGADKEINEHVVEGDLKKKHDEEEKDIAQNYAKKVISNPQRLTQEEMNRLLSEHALSMQALRKKQEAEKNKLKEVLEAKKNERLLKRRANQQAAEDENEQNGLKKGSVPRQIGVVTPIMASSRQDELDAMNKDRGSSGSKNSRDSGLGNDRQTTAEYQSDHSSNADSEDDLESLMSFNRREDQDYSDDFEEYDQEDEAELEKMRSTLQDDLWSAMKDNPNATSEDLKAVLEAFRSQEGNRKQLNEAERGKLQQSMIAKLAARNAKKQGKQEFNDDDEAYSSVDGDTEFDKKIDEQIAKKDREFSKKMKEKAKYLTGQEYAQFLQRHLAEVEELRRMKLAEKNRLDAKLKDKLDGRHKKGNNAQDSSEEDDFSENEETQEELRRMEEDLLRKVSKTSKTLSPEDLAALLDKYRREQAELIRQRKAQRTKADDKVKQKLEERKKMRAKVSNLDDEFFKNLQDMQKSGKITEDVFSSMLEAYMKQVDTVKKSKQRTKKTPQDLSMARETASNMVKEVEENAKQINDLRKREKDKMDEKLRSKLDGKKNKKVAVAAEGR